MSIDLNALKTELIGLAEGSLEDISDPQFMRLLSRAIDNRYEEVVEICDEAYMLEVTLTASSAANNLPLPSDFYKREDRNIWSLFEDDTFTCVSGGQDVLFWVKGSSLRFDYTVQQGEKKYLQYSKAPTRYTSMTATFLEEDAMELLLSEVQALYYAAIDENEPNASFSNSLSQANRLGL